MKTCCEVYACTRTYRYNNTQLTVKSSLIYDKKK